MNKHHIFFSFEDLPLNQSQTDLRIKFSTAKQLETTIFHLLQDIQALHD